MDQLQTIGVVSGGRSGQTVLLEAWNQKSRRWISSRLLELFLEVAENDLFFKDLELGVLVVNQP